MCRCVKTMISVEGGGPTITDPPVVMLSAHYLFLSLSLALLRLYSCQPLIVFVLSLMVGSDRTPATPPPPWEGGGGGGGGLGLPEMNLLLNVCV